MPDMPGGGGAGGGTNPFAKAAKIAGKAIAAAGRSMTESAGRYAENVHPVEYRKGGKIRKTKARSEERVITKRKPMKRLMKKAAMKVTDKRKKKDRKDSAR